MKITKKYMRKTMVVLSSMMLFILIGSKQVQAQNASVSFQLFYDELSPYGEWINDPEYGYMWLPDVDRDFQPYGTNGRWVNTQYGNTWYSDYDWGWAPFHYGRWHYDDYYGWAWVPGYEWGPAWVSWRQNSGYYGWAPLRPGVSVGISVDIPLRFWVFVPSRYILSPSIYRYYTPYRNNVRIYNQTTIIRNTYVYNNNRYYSGPDRRSLERSTRNQVVVHQVRSSNRPGRSSINSNSVALYRPSISREGNKNARPSRVVDRKNLTSQNNRTSNGSTVSAVRPSRSSTSASGGVRTNQRPKTQSNQENNRSIRPSRTTTERAGTTNSSRPSVQSKNSADRATRQSSTNVRSNRENKSISRETRPNNPIQKQENQRTTRPAQKAAPQNRPSRSPSTPPVKQSVSTKSASPAAQKKAVQPQRSSRATSTRPSTGKSSGVQTRTSRTTSKATGKQTSSTRNSRSAR